MFASILAFADINLLISRYPYQMTAMLALHPLRHPLCRQNFPRIHWEHLGRKTSARGVRDKVIVRGIVKLLSFFLAFGQLDDVIKVQVILLMEVKE